MSRSEIAVRCKVASSGPTASLRSTQAGRGNMWKRCLPIWISHTIQSLARTAAAQHAHILRLAACTVNLHNWFCLPATPTLPLLPILPMVVQVVRMLHVLHSEGLVDTVDGTHLSAHSTESAHTGAGCGTLSALFTGQLGITWCHV